MRRPVFALLACVGAAGCDEAPAPRGEVILFVDTDVAVPEIASRLRVDVYSTAGEWFESREIFLGNADEWPASFSLVHPDDRATVESLVRLRAFPEGATRSYRGERWDAPAPYEGPVPASSVEELCADPPELALGGTVTLRRGREPIFPADAFDGDECDMTFQGSKFANSVGSVAARVEVTTTGLYRFAVVDTSPTLPSAPDSFVAQVTLELRGDCADARSGIACTHGIYQLPGGFGQSYGSAVDAELGPGTYWLVTGGVLAHSGVTDITLAAWSDDVPIYSSVDATVEPPPEAAWGPWLDGDPERTPHDEPDPLLTIDRVVRVSIEPHAVRGGRVVLRGECVGRPARLADAPGTVVATEMASCVDETDRFVAPTPPEPIAIGVPAALAPPSIRGAFAAGEPCAPADSGERHVCVPSGAFVLGARDSFDQAGLASPQRTIALHRFWIDKTELTVADLREALSWGFPPPGVDDLTDNPVVWSTPDALGAPEELCTWSSVPVGRDDRPLTCISWYAARAWCEFRNGDLPTSAELEYAGLRAGHAAKTIYPWGKTKPVCSCDGTVPGCRAAVFERHHLDKQACIHVGFGPAPAAQIGGPFGDESPLGIVGLAANVREWTLDSAHPLDHPCFFSESPWDPVCAEEFATARVQRAASFVTGPLPTVTTFFWQPAQVIYDTGVRCVYATRPF